MAVRLIAQDFPILKTPSQQRVTDFLRGDAMPYLFGKELRGVRGSSPGPVPLTHGETDQDGIAEIWLSSNLRSTTNSEVAIGSKGRGCRAARLRSRRQYGLTGIVTLYVPFIRAPTHPLWLGWQIPFVRIEIRNQA